MSDNPPLFNGFSQTIWARLFSIFIFIFLGSEGIAVKSKLRINYYESIEMSKTSNFVQLLYKKLIY